MAEKHSILTQEVLKTLLEYNQTTGVFFRKTCVNGRWPIGSEVGNKNTNGYIQVRILGRRYLAHRLAWLYMTGGFPAEELDHINGLKSDNRFCNLRSVNRSENMQNQRTSQRRTKGQMLGAHYQARSNRWLSQIVLDGKLRHLGSFDTPEEAHAAYLEAKLNLHLFNPVPRSITQ